LNRGKFSAFKKGLKRIGFAYHVCELIDGLCAENQENPEVFMLLGRTLRKLSKEKSKRLLRLRIGAIAVTSFPYQAISTRKVDTQSLMKHLERSFKTSQCYAAFYRTFFAIILLWKLMDKLVNTLQAPRLYFSGSEYTAVLNGTWD